MNSELTNTIGTKDFVSLTPKTVIVKNILLEEKKNKQTAKAVGKLVTLECLHPDIDDLIKISKVKMLQGDKLKVSGLWYNTDSEGRIQKGSAIATLLSKYNVQSLQALQNNSVETVQESDSSRYLVIKAY